MEFKKAIDKITYGISLCFETCQGHVGVVHQKGSLHIFTKDKATMSDKEEPEVNAACSFCGKLLKNVELMFSGGEQLAICNECITRCMAVIDDRKSFDIPYPRFLGEKYRETNRKLRPITKLPEGWKIKDTELYATEPYVTGCSPDGKRYADFAIPKQLAWWIISNDKALDVDELRAEITKHLTYVIWQTLLKY